jgi:hypothetical protein
MHFRVLRVSISWLRTMRYSSIVSTSRGLAELDLGYVAMQIIRRRARLPSCPVLWR